jgi:hypothetical protein
MDWINIADKQPDEYKEVIICSDEGKVKSAIYVGNGKWNTFLKVTYWMPMPEAPVMTNEEVSVEPVKKKRGRPKKS